MWCPRMAGRLRWKSFRQSERQAIHDSQRRVHLSPPSFLVLRSKRIGNELFRREEMRPFAHCTPRLPPARGVRDPPPLHERARMPVLLRPYRRARTSDPARPNTRADAPAAARASRSCAAQETHVSAEGGLPALSAAGSRLDARLRPEDARKSSEDSHAHHFTGGSLSTTAPCASRLGLCASLP